MVTEPSRDPYVVAWSDLRRRRFTYWIAILTFMPVAAFHKRLGRAEPYVMLPFMAIVAVSLIRALFFRCPKCGHVFSTRRPVFFSGIQSLFSRSCRRCGIAIGATIPAAGDVPREG